MSVQNYRFAVPFLFAGMLQGLSGAQDTETEAPDSPPAGEALASESLPTGDWREIGPAVFGGRIVDVALYPGDRSSMLAASGSGGLWRTRNNGVTWECIFENEGTISIGDVALDPTDEDVIWVGTGEANNQRSSYWGDGIYKTTDGGESWSMVGLPSSHHIGRIVIDPRDTKRVFVAVLGNLYSSNVERGLYRTTDGGETWELVLQINEDVGVVDVVIDSGDSSVLYAASYERRRRAWDFDGSGPGSGIHKSEDGGDTWTRLAGGLPDGELGRIGLAMHGSDPGILYATVPNMNKVEVEQDPAVSFRTRLRKGELEVREVQEGGGAAESGLKRGDVLLRLGDVDLNSVWSVAEAFGAQPNKEDEKTLALEFTRDDKPQSVEVKLSELMRAVPIEPRYRQVGGEIYRSTDGGQSFEKRNKKSVAGSPPYYYGQIRVDPNDSERLYLLSVPVMTSSDGGENWSGNIAGSVHVDHHALEIDPEDSRRLILGNDGGLHQSYDQGETWYHYENLPLAQFYAVGVDMAEPYNVYGGTQDNGTWGGPSRSAQRGGILGHEWYSVGGGDGFYAVPDPRDSNTIYGESQFGAVYRKDLVTGASKSIRPRPREGEERYRFNWNSPIVISHHNHEIVYFAGNRLFKSFNRGDDWHVRSEDLSTQDAAKLEGNVPHCTITTVAESPFDPNKVLVGTDDGLVHLTEDGCLTFTNLAGRFPGVPSGWWVNRVEFSAHDAQRAWVVFSGYREDDFRPFVYTTGDGGQSWKLITRGLHQAPVNVIREDPVNPDLLYLGTELGAFYSLNAGEDWLPLGEGLPTIPVYDLVVHPRDGEVVLGTHGRGFWVLNVSLLRQLSGEALSNDVHLFSVQDSVRLPSRGNFAWSGDGGWAGKNPAGGVDIHYRLSQDELEKSVKLEIFNSRGESVGTPKAPSEAGIHTVRWTGRSSRGRFGSRGSSGLTPGEYRVVLGVDLEEHETWFEVRSTNPREK
jgi:photosystem II stability/assembly factor-like uncharacterized protein